MSAMPEGPGWWIASDDKWYPPHPHPSVRLPDPPSSERPAENASLPVARSGPDNAGPLGSSDGSPGRVGLAAGGSSGNTGFPSDGGSPQKRERRPLVAVVSLVVILLVAVGAVTVFGGSQSAGTKVADAVTTSLNDGTAHMTVTLAGTAASTEVTGTGFRSIDFTNNAAQLNLTVGADGQQEPVDAVYQGGVVYETIPGLSTVVPGTTWLSIDLSGLQKEEAQDPSSGSLGSNPAVMLQMVAQQGNTVVSLGPSTIDGTAVNGYTVTVNPAHAEAQIEKANLPSWMRQAASGSKVHDLHVKVYVDQSGLLRSMAALVSESTGAAGSASFTETEDFSDYGTPVSITAPPASPVEGFQQLLQAAGAQGSSLP